MGGNFKSYKKRQGLTQHTGNKKMPQHKTDDQGERIKYAPKVSLREDQVGITEYVNDIPGFTGVIKSRFSDFHVNEIDGHEKILQLNDLYIPRENEETLSSEALAELRRKLSELLSSQQCEQIEKYADSKTETTDKQGIEIEIAELNKEQRTEVHQVFKKLYKGNLVSTTVNIEVEASSIEEHKIPVNKRILKIKKSKTGRENRNQWHFSGQYVHFLMHKENMDTSEVASVMANRLRLHPSQVNYCGTKDKRAKTTQKFCIKKRAPSQIVGSIKFLKNVYVGNFEFNTEVLKLGDLKGNRFRIALRQIRGDRNDIELALHKIRDHGFINYFGLQRFGNCASVPTYEIGVALLKADYKLACELILKPRENEAPFMCSIRETWWKDRNSAAAAKMFHNDKFIEKKVLDGLTQYGENDYASALRKIPRNMLMLYTHAWQSLIFNKIVTRRISEFGFKLLPGDLVYRNKDELDENTDETPVIDEDNNEENSIILSDEAKTIKSDSIYKRKVKPLTTDDISSNNYNMFDVVLPLPGYDITYPDNSVSEWYKELLAEYGLCSDSLRNNVKAYALAGSYRKLIIQPVHLKWEFRMYDNNEDTLILSDWEILKGKELTAASDNAKYEALILDFSLPPSVYATMMLRELLKMDTSPQSQANLQQTSNEDSSNKEAQKRSVNEQDAVRTKLIKLD